MLIVLKVFIFGLMIDVGYAFWAYCVAKKREHMAALASIGIFIPGILGLFDILDNKWLSIPYGVGLYLGTIIGIRMGAYLDKKAAEPELPRAIVIKDKEQ